MPVEGTWRSHQVPLADVRAQRRPSRMLEEWLRSYRPEELFDERRRGSSPELRGAAPDGRAADEREPARERRPAPARARPARLPRLRRRGGEPGTTFSEATRVLGDFLRDVIAAQPGRTSASSARTRRRRTGSATSSRLRRAVGGRRSSRPTRARAATGAYGGALRAPVPGLARGLPADRPPRPLQLLRGVHPHRRLDVQPAREVAEGDAQHPVAPADRVAQLPPHLARLAAGPQRLLAPGSRLHRPRREQEGGDHPRLPAAGREHAALRRRPLPAQQATT